VPAFLNVEVLGHRRQARRLSAQLLTVFKNDFGGVIVIFYFAADLDQFAG
jgi:hypothetical protein